MNPELTPSQSPLTIDEFEVLEDIEIEPNTLSELLYELDEEVENCGANTQYNTVANSNPSNFLEEVERDLEQSIEVVEAIPGFSVKGNWCLDNLKADFSNLNWLNMVEEAFVPCNDIGAWYEGICVEEMNEMLEIDYSLSHNGTVSDEIGYITLWQEN